MWTSWEFIDPNIHFSLGITTTAKPLKRYWLRFKERRLIYRRQQQPLPNKMICYICDSVLWSTDSQDKHFNFVNLFFSFFFYTFLSKYIFWSFFYSNKSLSFKKTNLIYCIMKNRNIQRLKIWKCFFSCWVYALIYTDFINSFDHRDDDVRRLCVDPVGLFYQQHT